MDDLRGQIEALTRFSGDVQSRLTDAGVAGIGGVLATYEQIRGVLDGLGLEELEHMLAEITTLQHTLAAAARELEALRQLKSSLS